MAGESRHADEDKVDVCVCDIVISDSQATLDIELPPSQGGVEAVGIQDDAGQDIDGCDLEFNEADATPDEELPAAVGGVA